MNRYGVTGLLYSLYPYANNMSNADAAFSNPLARARWGSDKGFEVQTSSGTRQQARFTFTGGPRAFLTTVRVLQEMASKYVADPEVVQFTRRLFNGKIGKERFGLRNHDELGEIQRIVSYFQGTHTIDTPDSDVGKPKMYGDQGSYRYQKDPYSVELFQSPPKVIRDIQAGESGADCDDIAAACACVLNAAGYPSMLMIVDAGGPKGAYSHVMLATRTFQSNPMFGGDWFPVELIHPFPMGQSVRISSYIPLLVEDYDLTPRENRLIPKEFR
tara:strand:- start:1467 stop:2282 length:816 start_codon:yes stop_codon:yes gene_type:complete